MEHLTTETLDGDEALVATANYFFQALRADARLKSFVVPQNLEKLAKELRTFLSRAFDGGYPKMEIGPDLVSSRAFSQLVDILQELMKRPLPLGEDALVAAVAMLGEIDDGRVMQLFKELERAAVEDTDNVEADEEAEEDELEFEEEADHTVKGTGAFAGDVNTSSLEDMVMPAQQAEQVQNCWRSFLDSFASREIAGEAIYGALFDSAPSLQSLFKTPRAVMSLRFMMGINQIIMSLQDGQQVRLLVEALGFQHLDLEVTVPRVAVFRDAIMDLLASEMGSKVTPQAAEGLRQTLNYAGGGYIFIREKFSERLKILTSSWKIANGTEDEESYAVDEMALEEKEDEEDEEAEESGEGEESPSQEMNKEKKGLWDSLTSRKNGPDGGSNFMASSSFDAESKDKKKKGSQQDVPTTFNEMFRFNAAVMGLSNRAWMFEVLLSFDAIVKNIANSYRLQEECDVLALKITKIPGEVKLAEYKAVMLASLRSLVPKDWDTHHEVAWNWLWDNVERMLEKELGKPAGRQRVYGRFLGSLEDDTRQTLRQEVYSKFFVLAPAGQDYFKQSTTRLYFIADKILEMTLDMYKEPKRMVDDISALGLRHVGYGIPTEFFSPFVTACVEVVRELMGDEKLVDAFGWSLGLISRVLVRTINEGSTIVMKAINTNSVKQVKKALSCAPRGKRALWMLNVTVGTQSISPLVWSISSGSLEAASVILQDLLTIRADRDRYYYGVDEIFKRHPDIVEIITNESQALLPLMMDGMIWRSRVAVGGYRRVNYFLKHLLVNSEGQFADAMSWICKMQDPHITTHPLLVTLSDLVWNSIIYRTFLLGKMWLMFTIVVYLFSQAVVKNMSSNPEGTDDERIATFACRAFVYLCSMVELLYSRTKYACKAFKEGDTIMIGRLPVPRRYLEDWHEANSMLLTFVLSLMFMLEPVLYCMQSYDGDFEGSGLFTQSCSEANDVREVYTVLSMLAMLLYFALLIDFTALSTRLSAFVLVTARVIPELALTLVAAAYIMLTFSSAVTATNENNKDFDGIARAALSFFEIAIGIYSGTHYEKLHETPGTMLATCAFIITVTIFLFNVLIAQLICAYQKIFSNMLGYARLSRMDIVCDTMPSIPRRRFAKFVEDLKLDERMEFGEGDVGLPGGIQVTELAGLHPTTVDSIRRFGGSTSPAMQWPEEEEDAEADKFERLEKTFQKAMKKMLSSKGGSGSEDTGVSGVSGSDGGDSE
mmetsp:Transcript_23567/g.42567  ORF Transcript_23567/g.42567 Transcript_23567/m.42567 type:complete len:1226 (-) Transcript_23567:316-3993(-)